jgi:hypothetical protein
MLAELELPACAGRIRLGKNDAFGRRRPGNGVLRRGAHLGRDRGLLLLPAHLPNDHDGREHGHRDQRHTEKFIDQHLSVS